MALGKPKATDLGAAPAAFFDEHERLEAQKGLAVNRRGAERLRRKLQAEQTEKWDRRFVDLARAVSLWSKDRSTKVGAIIVGPNREILSTGYNGFPRGLDDSVEERHERPTKYFWTEHAERNAIYNAARHGIRLEGTTMYVTWFPCADCARGIIQSGIVCVVSPTPDMEHERWGESFRQVAAMFAEAGITRRHVD